MRKNNINYFTILFVNRCVLLYVNYIFLSFIFVQYFVKVFYIFWNCGLHLFNIIYVFFVRVRLYPIFTESHTNIIVQNNVTYPEIYYCRKNAINRFFFAQESILFSEYRYKSTKKKKNQIFFIYLFIYNVFFLNWNLKLSNVEI